MSGPFTREGDQVRVALSRPERALLKTLPEELDRVGTSADDPGAARLDPAAYRDDDAASDRFRDLVADDLRRARAEDRRRLVARAGADTLDLEEAESWMRVIGEARLVIAARVGIEDESWETERSMAESREGMTLQYLSYLQDSLVRALSEGF